MSEAIGKLIQWGATKDSATGGRVLRGTITLECGEAIAASDWPAGREAAKERIAAALAERVVELADKRQRIAATVAVSFDAGAALEQAVQLAADSMPAIVATAAPGSTQTSADGERGSMIDTDAADATGAKSDGV